MDKNQTNLNKDVLVDAVVSAVVQQLGTPRVMTLDMAKVIVDAVEKRAQAEGKRAVIAVAGADGNPVAVHVMDGAFLVSYEVAVKKA